jgi:hypothetical protein
MNPVQLIRETFRAAVRRYLLVHVPGTNNLADGALKRRVHTRDGFKLTGAIRPVGKFGSTLVEGYCRARYEQADDFTIPLLWAAVSAEKIMDVVMASINEVARGREYLGVVLDSKHHDECSQVQHFSEVDAIILQSVLWDYEDLLLNDGCFVLAVIDNRTHLEVQLDDHKLLAVYGSTERLAPFEQALIDHDVPLRPDMRFICQKDHVHISNHMLRQRFNELSMQLGGNIAEYC